MVTAILIVKFLVGIGVVLFGIREKYKYGFVTQFNIESLIVVVVSVLKWPLVIALIVNFVRTQKEVIKKVLIDHPNTSRDDYMKNSAVKPTCAYYLWHCVSDSCILNLFKIQWMVALYSGGNLAIDGVCVA